MSVADVVLTFMILPLVIVLVVGIAGSLLIEWWVGRDEGDEV